MQDIFTLLSSFIAGAKIQFTKSPAEWTTAILLLLTLFFTVYLTWSGRKIMRVRYDNKSLGREDFLSIIATNISDTRKITLSRCGYKTWYGEEWSKNCHEREIETDLRFEEILFGNDNKIRTLKDRPTIYYAFVEDTSGKKYKRYAYWRPISWIIRFWNYLFF